MFQAEYENIFKALRVKSVKAFEAGPSNWRDLEGGSVKAWDEGKVSRGYIPVEVLPLKNGKSDKHVYIKATDESIYKG